MYTGFQSKHFVAVELVDGLVHYSYDVGRGPRVMRVSQPGPVHDNRWHTVEVLQPSPFEHILRVDNASKADIIHDVRSTYLDVDEKLYFGGVPEGTYDSLPKQVVLCFIQAMKIITSDMCPLSHETIGDRMLVDILVDVNCLVLENNHCGLLQSILSDYCKQPQGCLVLSYSNVCCYHVS